MRKKPVPRGTPRRMPVQKAHAPRNAPSACRRKRPMPRETPLPHRLPAQKAHAPRNSPPHAGAKGPCSAERPTAACRQSDIRQRGKRFRPLHSPPDKNNDLSGQKGTAADFFTSPPETGAAPLSENPSEGTHRNPIRRLAPGARAEVPAPVQNPPASPPAQPPRKSCQKRAILPTDAIGKKRRGFHRQKASTSGLLTKYACKKTV